MINSTEDLLNQIELLKQALLFYGDTKNYQQPQYDSSVCVTNSQFIKPLIFTDNGEQARFALKRLQETVDLNQEMEDDYIKEIKENYDNTHSQESVLRLIEEMRKIGGENDGTE